MKQKIKRVTQRLGIIVLTSMGVSVGQAAISVNVDGTTYQCGGGSGGGGGGSGGTNLCRCRAHVHSSNDTDYYLEKYNPSTGQYRGLQSFRLGDGQDAVDRQNCLDAREDPVCFFADSRFVQIVPITDESSSKD